MSKSPPGTRGWSKIQDFIDGDGECFSCTGVVYFSQSIKSRGGGPICFGYKQQLAKKVSKIQHDSIEKVVDKPNIKLFLGAGVFQWTRRIDRLGMLPLTSYGKALVLVSANFDSDDTSRDREEASVDKNNNDNEDGDASISSSSDGVKNKNSNYTNSTVAASMSYLQKVKLFRDIQNNEATVKEAVSKTFSKVFSYEGIEKAALLGFNSTVNALTKLYNKISSKTNP